MVWQSQIVDKTNKDNNLYEDFTQSVLPEGPPT